MGSLSSGRANGGPSETSVDIASLNRQEQAQKGMILPFEPLALTFHNVSYYVDMPAVSCSLNLSIEKPTLRLDQEVTQYSPLVQFLFDVAVPQI